MTAAKLAKGSIDSGRIVAVIASPQDFKRALKLRVPPDFFELRLDALQPFLLQLEHSISKLRAPLIITARHPSEGGKNNLPAAERLALLRQFLPRAAFVDVEVRSLRDLKSILRAAPRSIISLHPSKTAVDPDRSLAQAEAAGADVFKIVTRTDTTEQMETLLKFFRRHQCRLPLSAMGVGRLGREARLRLARTGSALNYVHLGASNIEGQLSLAEMRRAARRWRIT